MSFKRLLPLLDRVLVEKIAAPTKSAGGILLPEQAAAKVRRSGRTGARAGAGERAGPCLRRRRRRRRGNGCARARRCGGRRAA